MCRCSRVSDRALAGPLIALWSLGSLLAGLVYGAYGHRITPVTAYERGMLVLPLVTLPLALAGSFAAMVPLALLAGVAIAPMLTAANQLIGDVAPPGALTEAYTWPTTALVIGVTAGNAASGAVVEAYDWRAAFVLAARRRRRRVLVAGRSPADARAGRAALRRSARRPSPTPAGGRRWQKSRRSGARRGGGRARSAGRRRACRTARRSRALADVARGSGPAASQCAPWMTHGTTCSRRQKTARRSPAGSSARNPSSGSTPSPHQLHGSLVIAPEAIGADGAGAAAGISCARWPIAPRSSSSRATRPARSCSSRRSACSTRRLRPGARAAPLRFVARAAAARRQRRRARRRARRCARPATASRRRRSRPKARDDVGSPNRLLREAVGGKVIIRTGRRIPGITPIAGVHHPISIVRMAVDDAYGAKESREGEPGSADEIAFRTERIIALRLPRRRRVRVPPGARHGRARLRRPEVDRLARLRGDAQGGDGRRGRAPPRRPLPAGPDRRDLRGPDRRRRRRPARRPGAQPRRRLPERPRDADVRLDRRRGVRAAGLRRRPTRRRSRWPRPRTGPRPRSRARTSRTRWRCSSPARRCSTTRAQRASPDAQRASRAIYESVLEATAAGVRTPDLGGHASTTEFTSDVVERVRTKIDVWSSLGTAV